MKILLVNRGIIPVIKYGGTERVIWYLGRELHRMGHEVSYLVNKGSHCDFARIFYFDPLKSLTSQLPDDIDIVHFNFDPEEDISKPYIVTNHGNRNDFREFDINTVFVSSMHASRYGSSSYVYNGLDWDDYGAFALNGRQEYFHFLGNAAWRVKNVTGAIKVIKSTKKERLEVLGGKRLNISMGFRFTISRRVSFRGMVGGEEKHRLISNSKGLIFPVRWHEPFGLALTESLYFGCPVFGTPYGSLPEIVNKDVGFLSCNSKELAVAVENVNAFSRKTCHEYALEKFNARKMAESYLEKYLMVLNGEILNNQRPKLLEAQNEKFLDWS